MNYIQSLRYLNSFINYERLSAASKRSWDLKRMQQLVEAAGHPEKSFFPILIAGTKGKGSTGFFLESILKIAKIPVGFYSSPHLEDPRERIRINGRIISKEMWCEQIQKVKSLFWSSPRKRGSRQFVDSRFRGNDNVGDCATYFEVMTLMAFYAFQKAKVKIGILEAGMGGRLDATNVSSPKLVILTPIDLDHEAILGNTITKIAEEKAAIIRPQAHVVTTPQKLEALRVIKRWAHRQKASLYIIEGDSKFTAGLKGDYQALNAKAARQAAIVLKKKFGFYLPEQALLKGTQAENWPGRMESFKKNHQEILLDAAHNPVSMEALVRNLNRLYPNRPRILIFGTSKDKNAGQMLKMLSRSFSEIILTRARHPRSYEIGKLLELSGKNFHTIYPFANSEEGLKFATTQMPPNSLIVATGSFYLIGELRKNIKQSAKR